MIDPSFGETVTISPFPPTVQELESKIAELENSLAGMTQNYEYWLGKYKDNQAMIDNLEEYLKDNFDYIDEEVTQSLVDIFGLNINKEYDVTVTVTFSGSVSVPLGFDMDSLEDSLEARLDSSYYASEVSVDLMEDKMEIDWTEN